MDTTEGDKSVLRWGGLAGILGSVLLILVFAFVGVIVGPDPAGLEGPIERFPDIEGMRAVENGLYLAVLILWVAPFLALNRALRGTSPAPALFGSVLGILGLVVLAAGALPHVATGPLSTLYHTPGATPDERMALTLLWQGTQGLFDALLIVGLVLTPIGITALGAGMFGVPAFGRGIGGVSVGLGAAGVVAAAVLLLDPLSPIAVVGFFALIVFHLVLGWKVFTLSRAP